MFAKYVKANTIKEGAKTNQYENYDHGKNMVGIESGYYRSSYTMGTGFYCQIGRLTFVIGRLYNNIPSSRN